MRLHQARGKPPKAGIRRAQQGGAGLLFDTLNGSGGHGGRGEAVTTAGWCGNFRALPDQGGAVASQGRTGATVGSPEVAQGPGAGM